MALAIDGSSPAVATNAVPATATVTTASFTPPANSLLVILWAGNNGSSIDPTAPTITDNLGTHLTYTQQQWDHKGSGSPSVNAQSAIWTAPVTNSSAMTVTVTNNGGTFNDAALAIRVMTDTNGLPRAGVSGSSRNNTGNPSSTYTATYNGSWGMLVVADWDATGSMTAGTGMTSIGTGTLNSTDLSYGIFRRSTADGTNGSGTTVAATLGGSSTQYHWSYLEVLPALTPISSSETSTGTDSAVTLAAAITGAETGSAVDVLSARGLMALETGSAVELGAVAAVPIFASDSSSGADSLFLISATLSDIDTSIARDGSSLFVPPHTVIDFDFVHSFDFKRRVGKGPYLFVLPWAEGERADHRFFRRISVHRGLTLLRINGFYQLIRDPTFEQLNAADRIYLGGYQHYITDDEAQDLGNAGYADFIVGFEFVPDAFYGAGQYGISVYGD